MTPATAVRTKQHLLLPMQEQDHATMTARDRREPITYSGFKTREAPLSVAHRNASRPGQAGEGGCRSPRISHISYCITGVYTSCRW